MRTNVGVVVMGCFAAAAVCSCGIRHLTDPDAGLRPSIKTPRASAICVSQAISWLPRGSARTVQRASSEFFLSPESAVAWFGGT